MLSFLSILHSIECYASQQISEMVGFSEGCPECTQCVYSTQCVLMSFYPNSNACNCALVPLLARAHSIYLNRVTLLADNAHHRGTKDGFCPFSILFHVGTR